MIRRAHEERQSAVLLAPYSRVAYDRWARFAAGRGGLALMFTWAMAEAIVWPVIPDALLVGLAAANRRRFQAPLAAAVAGMTLGGTALYLFAFHTPRRARRLLKRLPFVPLRQVAAAEGYLARHGAIAFLWQPWSGVPLKVWAVVAGGKGIAPLAAIPLFVVARSLRMGVVAALAGGLAERFADPLRNYWLWVVGIYVALFAAGWWRLIKE